MSIPISSYVSSICTDFNSGSTDITTFSSIFEEAAKKMSPAEAHRVIKNIEQIKEKNDKYLKSVKKSEEKIRQKKNAEDDSKIKKVIFNKDVTIVFWNDNTKTVVKRNPADIYDAEKALLACMAKKFYDGNGFNRALTK